MKSNKWEYGGEFHWCLPHSSFKNNIFPYKYVLYGSGRDALRALLQFGRKTFGWRNIWMPSYFCQDVIIALKKENLPIKIYPDMPTKEAPDLSYIKDNSRDVILIMNYFGLRGKEAFTKIYDLGLDVIENHTHDPWSNIAKNSQASYIFVSLRKSLPIPSGGLIYSPKGMPLPKPIICSQIREQAIFYKLTAMLFKELYLRGFNIPKIAFRNLQLLGESNISEGTISGAHNLIQELLPLFPWKEWRNIKLRNWRILTTILQDLNDPIILKPLKFNNNICPFSLILIFSSKNRRDKIRNELINSNIYPAILWPLKKSKYVSGEAEITLSNQILSIPCDFRYEKKDLQKVAEKIISFL